MTESREKVSRCFKYVKYDVESIIKRWTHYSWNFGQIIEHKRREYKGILFITVDDGL